MQVWEMFIATADGLKIKFESCHGLQEQSMYYNGWVGGQYITNLFVYSIEGRIIEACINVPGAIHYSSIAHMFGVYDKLEEKHLETGGKCVVDSAFAAANRPYLIRSAQDLTRAEDADERVRMQETTSLRQTPEWGMRAIQGAFPRLKHFRRVSMEPFGPPSILSCFVDLALSHPIMLYSDPLGSRPA